MCCSSWGDVSARRCRHRQAGTDRFRWCSFKASEALATLASVTAEVSAIALPPSRLLRVPALIVVVPV